MSATVLASTTPAPASTEVTVPEPAPNSSLYVGDLHPDVTEVSNLVLLMYFFLNYLCDKFQLMVET